MLRDIPAASAAFFRASAAIRGLLPVSFAPITTANFAILILQ
jgi:hypothetical protein